MNKPYLYFMCDIYLILYYYYYCRVLDCLLFNSWIIQLNPTWGVSLAGGHCTLIVWELDNSKEVQQSSRPLPPYSSSSYPLMRSSFRRYFNQTFEVYFMDLNLPIMLSTEKITLNICVHRNPSPKSVTLISSSRCSVLLPTDDSLRVRSRDDSVTERIVIML